MTRIPLPYPNGWICVEYADDLAKGEVKPLRAFGRDYVLFRDESGQPRVLDAFCPHLGAHLALGGRVVGEAIECPFHGWRFDAGSGECVHVPYARKVPTRGKTRAYRVVERNGFIFMWHHTAGEEPSWEMEAIPEQADPSYKLWGRHDWTIASHPQEVMENGVDLQHFSTLHGWIADRLDWVPEEHRYSLKIHLPREKVEGQAATAENADQVDNFNQGPGFTCTKIRGAMTGLALNTLTLVDPEVLRIRHLYYYREGTPLELVEGFFTFYVNDYNLDVPIWEKKVYRPTPVLADGDGPVGRYRRWFRQFYAEDVSALV